MYAISDFYRHIIVCHSGLTVLQPCKIHKKFEFWNSYLKSSVKLYKVEANQPEAYWHTLYVCICAGNTVFCVLSGHSKVYILAGKGPEMVSSGRDERDIVMGGAGKVITCYSEIVYICIWNSLYLHYNYTVHRKIITDSVLFYHCITYQHMGKLRTLICL